MSFMNQLNVKSTAVRARSMTWVERLHALPEADGSQEADSHRIEDSRPSMFDHLIDGFALGAAALYSSPWYLYSGESRGPTSIGYGFDKMQPTETCFSGRSEMLFRTYDASSWFRVEAGDPDAVDFDRVANDNADEGRGGQAAATPSIVFRWVLGVKSAVTRIYEQLEHRRAIARSRWSLMQMDDRLLRDIGLEREQIGYAVQYRREMDPHR